MIGGKYVTDKAHRRRARIGVALLLLRLGDRGLAKGGEGKGSRCGRGISMRVGSGRVGSGRAAVVALQTCSADAWPQK